MRKKFKRKKKVRTKKLIYFLLLIVLICIFRLYILRIKFINSNKKLINNLLENSNYYVYEGAKNNNILGDITEYINKNISEYISASIKRRDKMIENHFKELNFVENEKGITCSYVMFTILVNAEAMGMILIISEDEKLGENEMQLAGIVSSFMTKYLEQ